jgi:UDP-N-acetyl-D-mannosaminuronic acid dehydrogenase
MTAGAYAVPTAFHGNRGSVVRERAPIRLRPSFFHTRDGSFGMAFTRDIVIIGGCGHVGLPLGLAFADAGLSVALYDVNKDAVANIEAGRLPFNEPGMEDVLPRVLGRSLVASADASIVSTAETLVVVVGTPVGGHLSPDPEAVPRAIEALAEHLVPGQLLVLRSTVYPGVTALVEKLIGRLGIGVDVAFCPERIAEGKAMVELRELPQIVSGRTETAADRAEKVFRKLTDQVIRVLPEEAELAKLFTNTWRYIRFAIANQCYMIANDFGVDFERVREAVAWEYPRAADFPRAGFSAGPCLLKDTMQLAAFYNNNFALGHAAMMVNEGLPLYMVSKMEQQYDLSELTVGILGMSFKAESDDIRSSLSYKLKRILRFKAREVLCTDPYVRNDLDLVSLEEVCSRADLLIIATPHDEYRTLHANAPVVDIWGLHGQGVRV